MTFFETSAVENIEIDALFRGITYDVLTKKGVSHYMENKLTAKALPDAGKTSSIEKKYGL